MRRVIISIGLIAILCFSCQQQTEDGVLNQVIAKGGCPAAVARVAQKLDKGLHRFPKPPYNLDDWSAFHGNVESELSAAEGKCACFSDPCVYAREAISDLHWELSDLDYAIRHGFPIPSDRAELHKRAVDEIGEAVDLVHPFKM